MASRKKSKKQGYFIAFEGGEGAGKTTQINRLVDWLKGHDLKVLVTRQPGGTPLGTQLRELVLHTNQKISPRAELLMYLADRAQHADTSLRPALDDGQVIVTDRYADSSTVYQGICRKLGVDWVIKLNDFATAKLYPDLVILIDVPVDVGRARMKGRPFDRIENEARQFHENVRKGFLKIAKRFSRRYLVVDGTRSETEIAAKIQEAVAKKLARKGLGSW